MTKLNGDGYISIVQLIIYIPCFALAIFNFTRQGLKHCSGWFYTTTFCIIRIVGAALQLCTYNNQSQGLLEAVAIVNSIGLAPLLLAALGILHRFHRTVNTTSGAVLRNTVFTLIHLIIVAALGLSIDGGTNIDIDFQNDSLTIPTASKIGIFLFVAGWLAVVVVNLLSFSRISYVSGRDRVIPMACGLALVVIAVRLIYSILVIFANNSTFNLLGGSVPAKVTMETVEEIIAIVIYLFLGFFLPKMNAAQVADGKQPSGMTSNDTQNRFRNEQV